MSYGYGHGYGGYPRSYGRGYRSAFGSYPSGGRYVHQRRGYGANSSGYAPSSGRFQKSLDQLTQQNRYMLKLMQINGIGLGSGVSRLQSAPPEIAARERLFRQRVRAVQQRKQLAGLSGGSGVQPPHDPFSWSAGRDGSPGGDGEPGGDGGDDNPDWHEQEQAFRDEEGF